ncbi:nucleotidyltransferase family protein [Candidatus Woesearchaeota archaeon]|nr:nucleotidyltransferase family protein [Candidatus Woesearchaeota archaeon]
MKVILLAAGYATRLYPLTKDRPKPLLHVGGKPIVDHIIKKIEGIDEVDEIFIITNDKFYNHFMGWLSEFRSPKKIKIINDLTTSNDDRLGSLGDVNFVIKKENIQESILIVAGDNLFEFSLKDFVESHKKHNKSAVALYDVQDKELARQYGIVGVDSSGKMVEFEEKPDDPKSTLASTGVYIYPPHVLPMLNEFVTKYKNSDKAGNFLEWLHKEEHVYCYITDKRWFDIGTLDQLEKAKKEFKVF